MILGNIWHERTELPVFNYFVKRSCGFLLPDFVRSRWQRPDLHRPLDPAPHGSHPHRRAHQPGHRRRHGNVRQPAVARIRHRHPADHRPAQHPAQLQRHRPAAQNPEDSRAGRSGITGGLINK